MSDWYSNSEGRFGPTGAKGDLGEQIVDNYCEKRGIPFTVANDRHSQTVLKIDCYIDGIPVDVKSNYWNGCLAVELYLKKRNIPGWIFTTKAHQIYGVNISTSSIYRYEVEDMLRYVVKNKSKATKTKTGDVIMYVPVTEPFIVKIQ